MILIDTSAWIDLFRNRRPLAEVVDRALEDDEAALCGPVLTELRRGLSSTDSDFKQIRDSGEARLRLVEV